MSPLPKCREKLGLNFPPLDLGTTTSLLNISISDYNLDCWNGSEIGSYIVDQTISSISPAVSFVAFRMIISAAHTIHFIKKKLKTKHFQCVLDSLTVTLT